jgi:hypothetical protein
MTWKAIARIAFLAALNSALLGCSQIVEGTESLPGVADAQALIQETVARKGQGAA